MKKVWKYAAMPFIAAVAACILFFAVMLIPQSAIQENAAQSARELLSQPQYPMVFNTNEEAYKLDNYTDSQIIMQAYNLNSGDVSSVLSNPKHISEQWPSDMAVALDEVVNQGAENETNYVRYWMGFRIYVRPMLALGSYYTIRRVCSVTYFVLLFAALIAIAKKVNVKTAACLGISIALLNPSVVAQSLQFSCVFNLSFLFILFICCRDVSEKNVGFVFAAFGILTQLFDFYTTPIITWGLPLLVLLSMDRSKPYVTMGKSLVGWGYGYVSMWLVKLLLTTVFTDINGFVDGFVSFSNRVGITVVPELADKYNALEALKLVWRVAMPGTGGKLVFVAAIAVVLVGIVAVWRGEKSNKAWSYLAPLPVAIVPAIWFACSAQPTRIHAWFQHRSLAVLYFGGLLFVCSAAQLVWKKGIKKQTESN